MMTEVQRQQIMTELKEYIDSKFNPIDNEKLYPLKYMMHKYDVSQTDLSTHIFVSRQTIYQWLRNKRIIGDDHITKLESLEWSKLK